MRFSNNKIALATLVALSLTACSPNKTAEDYIKDAKTSITKNKNSDAIIELKNAIKVDLQNSEARFMLGSLYLKSGQAAVAEKELFRSLELGNDNTRVLPKLLKALNLQDKSDETIELITESENIAQQILPEVLLYKALAYSRMGKKEAAKQAITQANDISTDSVYSQLGDAYLKVDSSDIDSVIRLVNKIIIQEPDFTEAILVQGQLYFAKKDYERAIKSFEKYHLLLPKYINIRLFLANTYVKNNQFDKAQDELDVLLKIMPNHPFSNQLQGVIDFQKENFENALLHTEKALQNGLGTPSNRAIAGLSAFQLQKYELANQYLSTISKDLPKNHPIQRVLAMVQLKLGYNDDASTTLDSITNLSVNDANMLTNASFELLKEGKLGQAKKLIKKASTLVSEKPLDIMRIGILKLSINDLDGITDLKKAIKVDPDLPMAKMVLAQAYLDVKEYDKAMDLAKFWQHSKSSQVDGHNLAAKIYLLQNKVLSAEQEFNQTLAIDHNNSYALQYFIEQDLQAKKYSKAQEKVNRILAKNPDNIIALITNFRVQKLSGDPDDAIEKMKVLFNKNKQSLNIRLIYTKMLFIERHYEEVVGLLSKVSVPENTPPMYWALLGNSYVATEKYEKAIDAFDHWVNIEPSQINAWIGKISSMERLGDNYGALITEELWIHKQPENQTAIMLYPYYLIINNKLDAAMAQIVKFTPEQKNTVYVKSLYARIAYKKGDFKAALPGFIALYQKQASSENVNFIYNALMQQHKNKEALEFLNVHVAQHPKDYFSKELLAQLAVTKDNKLARKIYQDLLAKYPENLQYLNNLAWIFYKNSAYDDGFKLISKAMKLQPENPNVLDTAALIEFKRGNKKQAIYFIKKAKLLAPNDPEINSHYSTILND
ncbi:MAG: PEP-CTERM system TPR-repeat protein PrsT [Gammaproteobacteria bacterium]|nr:MAG: PEP-CTERM system TPR-repeat protein PrsT [Gammaproteobacteria bacterium]